MTQRDATEINKLEIGTQLQEMDNIAYGNIFGAPVVTKETILQRMRSRKRPSAVGMLFW